MGPYKLERERELMLIEKKVTRLSQWVSIVERSIAPAEPGNDGVYHSIQLADYVSVLAVDRADHIALVRQYRPALECHTIELPGGLLDESESPEACAERELFEETGLLLRGALKPLGCLTPDTGRLENRLWGFFAEVEQKPATGWRGEPGVEPFLVTIEELRSGILDGSFNHALHVALIGLAIVKGYLKL